MSNKAITWAYAQTGTEKLEKFVLVALADMADQDASCYPTNKTLSAMTGLAWNAKTGKGAVTGHIASLLRKGYITKEERRRRDGGQGSNRYYLQLDRVEDDRGVEDTRGVDDAPGSRVEETPGPRVESTPRNRKNPQENPQENPSSSAVAAETPGQKFAEPLCKVLAEQMQRNGVKVPEKLSTKWLDAARLIVDRDGRDPREARDLIIWATQDEFWRANVLSMPTFRSRYDQLRMQRDRAATRQEQTNRPTPMDHARSVHEQLLARKAAQQATTDTPKEIH